MFRDPKIGFVFAVLYVLRSKDWVRFRRFAYGALREIGFVSPIRTHAGIGFVFDQSLFPSLARPPSPGVAPRIEQHSNGNRQCRPKCEGGAASSTLCVGACGCGEAVAPPSAVRDIFSPASEETPRPGERILHRKAAGSVARERIGTAAGGGRIGAAGRARRLRSLHRRRSSP